MNEKPDAMLGLIVYLMIGILLFVINGINKIDSRLRDVENRLYQSYTFKEVAKGKWVMMPEEKK